METNPFTKPIQNNAISPRQLLVEALIWLWLVKALAVATAHVGLAHALACVRVAQRARCAVFSLAQSYCQLVPTVDHTMLLAHGFVAAALCHVTWLAERFSRPTNRWLVPIAWPSHFATQVWLGEHFARPWAIGLITSSTSRASLCG